MSHLQGISHKFIGQSSPTCELAPWSINRAVNKLMGNTNSKYGDHPFIFQELSDSEPKCFDNFCDLLAVPHAYGRQELPLLLKTIRQSGHNIKTYQGLRLLAEILRDPERALEAIREGAEMTLAELMKSPVPKIVRQCLIALEILAEQPQGKMAIVKSEITMTRLKSCFDHSLKVIGNASKTMLAVSSNYIAVDELLKAGCVQLLMRKLRQISADYDMRVQQETTLIYQLRALANLIELRREAKIDAIIHGALQTRHLCKHPSPAVRTAMAQVLALLVHIDAGITGMNAREMKETLLRNVQHATLMEDMSEMNAFLSNIMFTSIRSADRRSYASYQFVDELFSALPLNNSPKVPILQLLVNLAELPEMRARIYDRLTSCHYLLEGNDGEDVKACLDNLWRVLDRDA